MEYNILPKREFVCYWLTSGTSTSMLQPPCSRTDPMHSSSLTKTAKDYMCGDYEIKNYVELVFRGMVICLFLLRTINECGSLFCVKVMPKQGRTDLRDYDLRIKLRTKSNVSTKKA